MGTLYIVATPIGNLEDITIRALRILFSVSVIACEDTRRAGLLMNELQKRYEYFIERYPSAVGMTKRFISYYDEVEEKKLPELIALLESDQDIALISDAGTPLISDPGFRIVRECIKRNIRIESIPGASSVLTALASSGLPTNNFSFIGFLPQTQPKRKKLLEKYLESGTTVIAFDAANRLQESLTDIKSIYGDIHVVIARELTKIHEEFIRGKISDIHQRLDSVKGEIVILFTT